MTYFFPFSSGRESFNSAANPIAPAPSTTAFSCSTNRKIARAICSSLYNISMLYKCNINNNTYIYYDFQECLSMHTEY